MPTELDHELDYSKTRELLTKISSFLIMSLAFSQNQVPHLLVQLPRVHTSPAKGLETLKTRIEIK